MRAIPLFAMALLAGCSPGRITATDVQRSIEQFYKDNQRPSDESIARCAPITAFQELGTDGKGTLVAVRFGTLHDGDKPAADRWFKIRFYRQNTGFLGFLGGDSHWSMTLHDPIPGLPCEYSKVELMHKDVSFYGD